MNPIEQVWVVVHTHATRKQYYLTQKQFGNTALHTFQKIVPQKDRFFEVRSQITFATCRTRNFGLWSDGGIMNEQVIELSVPVYKLVLRDCTEKNSDNFVYQCGSGHLFGYADDDLYRPSRLPNTLERLI